MPEVREGQTFIVRPMVVKFPRELPGDTRVLRVPRDMDTAQTGTATVTDLGNGEALVFWTGWRRPDGDHSLGEGRVCRYVPLSTLAGQWGLVPDVSPERTWDVCEVMAYADAGIDREIARVMSSQRVGM